METTKKMIEIDYKNGLTLSEIMIKYSVSQREIIDIVYAKIAEVKKNGQF